MGGALAFFGYFFLGIGPGIVFFFFIIAPKSFLVLLSFCSTFYWLLTLLIISCIFRGFLPFTASVGSYAGVLVASVAIQEAARYALWRGHELTTRVLDSHSRSTGHRFDVIDKLYLALGWGYGHGAAHVIFFSLSFITITTGDGTWYYDQCPSMSIFLAGSLYALAFGMLLPSLMVIAFEGYQQKHLTHVIYAPVMHMAASLLTLLNFSRNGCNIVMPLLLAIGVGNVVYAGQVCWRKGPHVPSVPLRRLSVDAPNPNTGDDNEDTHSHAELVTGMGPDSANDPTGANGGPGGAARRRARQPAGSQWPVIGTA